MASHNDEPIETITHQEANRRIRGWTAEQERIKLAVPAALQGLTPLSTQAFTFKLQSIYNMCVSIYNHNNPDAPLPFPELPDDLEVNAVRFYMGTFQSNHIGSTFPEACLMAVPVAEANLESRMTATGGWDKYQLDGEDVDQIYDFSFPCPPTCCQGGAGKPCLTDASL